ncbi:hypothetical protein BJX64DRAFT_285185 [Aspergillus heterothallicus]
MLKPKIRRCLPNAKERETLLPDILATQEASAYIKDALEQCAINGYLESSKVIAPEVFESSNNDTSAITKSFISAIQRYHTEIAEDILLRISLLRKARDRRHILTTSLEAALGVSNTKIAKKIITPHLDIENVSMDSLSAVLMKACEMDLRECVSLLLDYLVRTRDRLSANVPGWSNRGRNAHSECGRVLEAGLRVTIEYQFHHLTEILLFSYLECVPYLLDRPNNALDIMKQLREEELAAIPREKCVALLLHPLTTLGKQRLAHRLHATKSEPTDVKLTTQGKTFTAHKDILSFHSKYFSGLFRGTWKDRDHVTFEDENISPAVLEVIIDFVYGKRSMMDARKVSGEDVLAAADYFLMDGLKYEIEKCILGSRVQDESKDDYFSDDEYP